MRHQFLFSTGRRFTSAILGVVGVVTSGSSSRNENITRLEYWDHDPKDFDVYISNPTLQDLPTLLEKFDKEGLEVWPWIWTHPNDDGPHHVFVGISQRVLAQIQQLRNESCQNNILIIAPEGRLREVAAACNDPGVYARCQCGLVVDSKVELLNHEAKILMLDDERVIAFDCLTLV